MLTTRTQRGNPTDIALNLIHRAVTANSQGISKAAAKAVIGAAGVNEVRKAVNAVVSNTNLKKSKKSLRGSNGVTPVSGSTATYAPVSVGNSMSSLRAMITPSSNGCRVKYRELINSAVAGSSTYPTSFTLGTTVYQINPGLSSLFPWLSPQAVQYEQYRIHSMKFIFVPFVNTSVSGDIMMMADYNVLDPAPTTEQQFLDHPGAIIGSVWAPLEFRCQPSSMHAIGPRKFVRPCAVAGDLKTYDCGKFYIATNNTASATVGKLFVEYDVEFFTPQLVPSPATTPSSVSWSVLSSLQSITSGTPDNVGFTVAPLFDPLNIFLGIVPSSTAKTLTPPAGCYQIRWMIHMSAGTDFTFMAITLFKNGVAIPNLNSALIQAAGSGQTDCTLNNQAIVPLNGTDTISFNVAVNGVGLLQLVNASFLFELA